MQNTTTPKTPMDPMDPMAPQAYRGDQPMLSVALYRSEPQVFWSISFMGIHNKAVDYEFWSDYVVYKTNDLEYEHCKWSDKACMRINEDYDFEAGDCDQPHILTGSRTHSREDGSLTDFWDLLVFTVQDPEFWHFLEVNTVEGEYLHWGTDNLSMLLEIQDWARDNPSAAQRWLDTCDLAIAAKDPLAKIQRAIRQGQVD